jgi:7-keto-8-aminopelargonate synthetase-like enzyme
MTAASAAAAAGFYPNDLTKNVRSASYSGSSHDHYQQQHSTSLSGSNSNLKFSLLNIKDKIADKTQSLQKRIQQEWEAFQQQQEQMMIQQQQQQEEYRRQEQLNQQQRGFVAPTTTTKITDTTSNYNLEYHRPVIQSTDEATRSYSTQFRPQHPLQAPDGQELKPIPNVSDNGRPQAPSAPTIPVHPLQGIGSAPLPSSPVSLTQGWANRIEQNIAAIQNYIIQMEQRRPTLPSENMEPRNKVLESLADLQIICNEIKGTKNPL